MKKTISQIAREAGVSRATVYLTLKNNGIVLENLTHEKQGNSTLYGDSAVNVILSALRKADSTFNTSNTVLTDSSNSASDRLHELEIEVVRLNEAVKNKDELIAILKADKEELEKNLEEERGKRENENQTSTQKIEQLFLKLVNISEEKKLLEEKNSKPWWRRIFKK